MQANNQPDRLSRIEALVESNARAIQSNAQAIAFNTQAWTETRQIVESNARAIQALASVKTLIP